MQTPTQTERQALDAAIAAGANSNDSLTPAERRNLQRRLDHWELEHLRQLAKDQAEQIEQLTSELHDAQDSARMWQGLAIDRDQSEGPTAVGLTRAGQLVAVPQLTLTPPPATAPRWLAGSNCCTGKWSEESWFQRAHGQSWTAPWFGAVAMQDQNGQWWHHHFDAVIDDFGDLAEVPSC